MRKFKVIFRTEASGDYSGFSINEYSVDPFGDEDQIVNDFLTPDNFKSEDFHLIKRLDKYKDDGFLGHALNLNQVTVADFRKIGKQKVISLLDSSVPPATDKVRDESEFIKQFPTVTFTRVDTQPSDRLVVNKLISVIRSIDTDTFYYISKNFFETNLPPEKYDEGHKLTYHGIVYEPYVLIIWFDKNGTMCVCEYSGD